MQTQQILIWTIAGSSLTITIFFVFIYKLLRLYTEKRNEYEMNLKLQIIENERHVLSLRIEVQEETIQNISKEIHDNVNQLLTLSKLNLNSIQSDISNELSNRIQQASNLVTEAIKELTDISRNLSAENVREAGLLRSLEMEAERVNQLGNIKLHIDYSTNMPDIAFEKEIMLYRIFQEAVRNSIVHGQASIINVLLIAQTHHVEFSISDNGKGFDVELQSRNSLRQGLKNIRKRTESINGRLEIKSDLGIGTTITISAPI